MPTMPVDPADARHATLTREGYLEAELVRDGDRPVDLRFLDANPAASAAFGGAALAGRRLTELASALEASWLDQWDRAIRSGEPQRTDQPSADGTRWFDCIVTPVGAIAPRSCSTTSRTAMPSRPSCGSGRRAWRSPSTSPSSAPGRGTS